jgi:hypothetical protein
MKIKDDAGRSLKAQVSLSVEKDLAAIVIESRGAGRNKDYIPAFDLLFQRLAANSAELLGVELASREATKPLTVGGRTWPVRLTPSESAETMANAIRNAAAAAGRRPGARGSGNTTKRLRILFRLPRGSTDARYIVERIVGPGSSGDWRPQTNRGGLDRASAQSARTVVEALLADLPAVERRVVLRFLAESIREAAEADNDRWAVTLEPGYVRFNVGQVESVVLRPESVSLLVTGNQRIAGTTITDPYPAAGGSRLRNIPHRTFGRVLSQLGTAHLEAKSLARRRPCTRAIKDAHSPGIVEYFWAELGMPGTPPMPGHYGQLRRPLTRWERRQRLEDDRKLAERPDLTQTEKHTVLKQRLAQRLFRERLKAADCRCRITGVSDPKHLRASHIKPWAACDDQERQDPANGLLLAPHVDHLFDEGYLSFEDDGTVLVSPRLERGVLEAWGLDAVHEVVAFPSGQAKYLEYHRTEVFKRE